MQPIDTTLCFDLTRRGHGAVALLHQGVIREAPLPVGQESATLLPSIERLMQDSGVDYASLARIITVCGPGSYTGLRIGLATLLGLAQSSPAAISVISTLEAVAWVLSVNHHNLEGVIALDAGKSKFYTAGFRISNDRVFVNSKIDILNAELVIMDPRYWGDVAEPSRQITGSVVAALIRAAAYLPAVDLDEINAVYCRAADTTLPKQPLLRHQAD